MADPLRDGSGADQQEIRGVRAGQGDRLAEVGAPAVGSDAVQRRTLTPPPAALPPDQLVRARALTRDSGILRENSMVARARRHASGDRTAASPEQAAAAGERMKGGRDRFWAAVGQQKGPNPTHAQEPADRACEIRDEVVQTLYGVGLNLEALASLAQQPELREALERAVQDIDTVVASLRSNLDQLGSGILASHPSSGPGRVPD